MKTILMPVYINVLFFALVVIMGCLNACQSDELGAVSELSILESSVSSGIASEDSDTKEETFDPEINLSYAPPSDIYRYYNEAIDGNLIRNTKIVYNGNELSFPFTVQDMLDIGLVYANPEMNDATVAPGQRTMDGNDMLVPETVESVYFDAVNLGSEPCKLSECYVIIFGTASNLISINGIITGETKYEDMLVVFGKSNVFQTDSFEDEKASGRMITFKYESSCKYQKFGDYKISLACNVAKRNSEFGDRAGTVNYVSVGWTKE